MLYLAKGSRPDINNGPGVTRIVPTFWPQHLFKFISNNDPSQGHSNLGSDGRYTYSSLPLIVRWVPYLNKGCRPDFNNGLEGDSNSGPILASWCLFESNWNNGPSPGHSNLVSVYTSVQVSWWLPYLAKGPMPNFNRGPGNDSNIGCILALQHLFESNLNNSPSPSHSNLVSDRIYIYSGLLLKVSWWVPYLPKACRPDFNNGLGGDSNSDPILAPSVYLSPIRIMASPRATPILCPMKYTSVQVSYLRFPGGRNHFHSDVSRQIRL